MIMNVIHFLSSKVKNEKGQGMVEYALLVGLIAVVVIGALVFLGQDILAKFNAVVDAL